MRYSTIWSTGGLKRRDVRHDLLAALVVTAIAVPESLAFAALVGLPLQTGLYCALLAPIVFALLTSSRRLIIGADSATAVLVAAGAGAVAAVGSPEYAGAIALLGVTTGVLLVIMGYARFGFLVDLISRPVLVGFLAGVGVQLIVHKLPEMLGLANEHGTIVHILVYVGAHLGSIQLTSVAVAAGVIIISFLLWRRKIPGVLLGLGLASLAVIVLKLDLVTVGAIPAGLPAISLPPLSLDMLTILLPTAASIALVVLAQSSAVARSSASDHGERVRPNQDLVALGAANLASALTQGFAVNGSPPRTLAAEKSGGRSIMVNVYMALMVGAVLLFATGVFSYIPVAALAAVIGVIGLHLIRVREFTRIYKTQKIEFFIALTALIAVAVLGVRVGLLVAIVIALMERLRRQYRPSDQVLLRDGTLSSWAEARLGPYEHGRLPESILVYGFNGALFFENAAYFEQRLERAIQKSKKPVEYVIIDAGAIDDIDYTAAGMLRKLHHQLSRDDIGLALAHVPPHLRDQLAAFELVELIGSEHIFATLKQAIDAYVKQRKTVHQLINSLQLPKQDYVVIAGGVMEILGIRRTNNLDIVVSKQIYERYRRRMGWKEYRFENGDKIIVRHGVAIMTRWMDFDLATLRKSAFRRDGVHYMSIDLLIAAKQKLRRPKDLADIRLLRAYQKT